MRADGPVSVERSFVTYPRMDRNKLRLASWASLPSPVSPWDRRKGRPVDAWPAGLVMVPAGLASFETSNPEAGRQEAGGTEKRLRGD